MKRKIHFKSLILGIIIGLVLAGTGVYAAILYQSSEVGYDNSNSGLTSQNVQDALDELYQQQHPPEPVSFSTDSWPAIINAVKTGNTGNYNVGDTKEVDLGSLGKHTVRISNKTTPAECSNSDFSQTACGFVLEFTDVIQNDSMNYRATNEGGWKTSYLRRITNDDLYNMLPSKLKDSIIDTRVISGHGGTEGESNNTSTDKLYLLSTHEVYEDADENPNSGISYYDTSYNNTRQLDYYKSQGVTTRNYTAAKKMMGIYNTSIWLRSAYSYPTNDSDFYLISNAGYYSTAEADHSIGVSPAFRIG